MSPTTADVVARMRTIANGVSAGDGAGVFNGVFLRVTEMMLDRLTTGGVFHDDAFVAALDVRFADYWWALTAPPATNREPGRPCSPRANGAAYCPFNSRSLASMRTSSTTCPSP